MRRLLSFLLLALSSWAQAAPAIIWRVCISDLVVPPYLNNDPLHPGLIERLLADAGRQVGLSVILLRLPPARCRVMYDAQEADAYLVSPSPMLPPVFALPMKGGAVDVGKRLARINLVIVRRDESPYTWDGSRFGNLGSKQKLVIGVRNSLMIAYGPLAALHQEVDRQAVSTPQLLAKLAAKRIDLAVTIQEEVEYSLRDPALSSLVVLPLAFSSNDYYVAVHPQLPPDIETKVEAWWTLMGRLRDEPDYRVH